MDLRGPAPNIHLAPDENSLLLTMRSFLHYLVIQTYCTNRISVFFLCKDLRTRNIIMIVPDNFKSQLYHFKKYNFLFLILQIKTA